MKSATFLGNEEFFLLLLPLIYLCVNRRIGLRLGALILCCDALCGILKITFALPRPYWVDARVQAFSTEASFGFPSSHAMVSMAGWFFLARQSKRTWTLFAAAFLVALIAISRVFLGVHFLLDVVGGALIGIVFLLLFLKVEPICEHWFAQKNTTTQMAVSAIVALGILALFGAIRVLNIGHSSVGYVKYWEAARAWDGIVARAGAIFGLGCGASWAQKYARFDTGGSFSQKLARFVLAIVGVAICWQGLALVFPKQPETVAQVFRFLRYALLTIWVTFGAPFLLLKMKLLAPNRVLESATATTF